MIGVAGATGSVGRLVVAELARLGAGPLRLGGRRRAELQQIAESLPNAEAFPFDLDDPEQTARFCQGSSVVLNCAGPSYLILDRLARATRDAQGIYVDVSGDEPVYQRLLNSSDPFTAVLSAGMLPGLSSLVPRWMSQSLTSVDALTTYIGGLERCSPSSATDMILSMDADDGANYGQPLAAWRDGHVVPRSLRPVKELEVPFIPDLVSAHPFLSPESERLASDLRLKRHDFWNVFVGERLITTFTRMRGSETTGDTLDHAVQELTQAAELDLLGRDPYYALVFCMDGILHTRPVTRTAAIRTSDAYRLIASMAASTTFAAAHGYVPEGVGFAAEMLDPEWVVDRIRQAPAVDVFEVVDRERESDLMDEGAL